MTEPDQSKGVAQLLVDQTFGPFIFGRLGSHLSVWVHNLAAAVLVFQITGSAFAVGMLTVVQFMPQVLFSAWGGALSDRFDRRKMLMAGRAPAGLFCLLLAVVVAVGVSDTAVLVMTYVVGLGVGLGWALGVPAGHALTPTLVDRSSLTSAITLTATTGHISRMAGPAIAGVILVVGDAWMAFAAAGVGHLAFVLVLARLRVSATPSISRENSRIRDGVRYTLASPRLLVPILAGMIVSLGLEPMMTLAPALAVELGREGVAATQLATAFGLGGVGAVALVGRLQQRFGFERTASIGMGTVAVGLSAVLVVSFVPALVAFCVAGAGSTVAVVSLQSWIQHLVDETFRGRVMSLWALSYLGSRTVSATFLGSLGDAIGAGAATAVAGLGCAIGAGLLLSLSWKWTRDAA